MRITSELIQRCSSKNLLPAVSHEDHMQRITHLYLQEQYIRKIENLSLCQNLIALYLFDNKIEKLENLEDLSYLSSLYLQHNGIPKIENIQTLTQLTVLNLSRNCISKLEGLEALSELRELYLEYQMIPEGESMIIEDASVAGIAGSLRILNISGNDIKSLKPLQPLLYLEVLQAEDNSLADLQDLVNTVANWRYLNSMRLNSNPVCSVRKYRDCMVVHCLELEELDGRVITPSYRNFLLNWKQYDELEARKKESYAVLKPFLEAQIQNQQLVPEDFLQTSAIQKEPSSVSSSQSEASISASCQPKSKISQSETAIDRRSKVRSADSTTSEPPLRSRSKSKPRDAGTSSGAKSKTKQVLKAPLKLVRMFSKNT